VVTATGSPSIWSAGLPSCRSSPGRRQASASFSAGTTDTTSPSRTRQHHANIVNPTSSARPGRRPSRVLLVVGVSRSPKSARRVNRSRHCSVRPRLPAYRCRRCHRVVPASNERRYRRCHRCRRRPTSRCREVCRTASLRHPRRSATYRYSTLREDTRRCRRYHRCHDAGEFTPAPPPRRCRRPYHNRVRRQSRRCHHDYRIRFGRSIHFDRAGSTPGSTRWTNRCHRREESRRDESVVKTVR